MRFAKFFFFPVGSGPMTLGYWSPIYFSNLLLRNTVCWGVGGRGLGLFWEHRRQSNQVFVLEDCRGASGPLQRWTDTSKGLPSRTPSTAPFHHILFPSRSLLILSSGIGISQYKQPNLGPLGGLGEAQSSFSLTRLL